MRAHSFPTLFDRWLAEPVPRAVAAPAFQPPVDVLEHADAFEAVVDLPGVDREAVTVEFVDGVLEIRGERSAEAAPEAARVHRRERPAGRFARRLAFRDEVAVDGIEASFRDGVLHVRVPKSERSRPRQIPVSMH